MVRTWSRVMQINLISGYMIENSTMGFDSICVERHLAEESRGEITSCDSYSIAQHQLIRS